MTAEGTQAVGALLVLGLLSAPAGAAPQATSPTPTPESALSGLIAVAATWAGLALSYAVASLPPSSAIIGFAAAAYVLAAIVEKVRSGERRGRESRPEPPPDPLGAGGSR